MKYTIKENEKFINENLAKYETSSEVRNEFSRRGLHVDINKPSLRKSVEKHLCLIDCSLRNPKIPMVYGKNFEKTFHVYSDGRLNMTATCMNDGSNFYSFLTKGNFTRIAKIA